MQTHAVEPQAILGLLQQTETAVLATHRSDGTINARFMFFACDEQLKRFYLMTLGTTEKLTELARDAGATLSTLFLPAGGKVDKAAETIVTGRVVISQDFSIDWVQQGATLLGKKFPALAGFAASGSLGEYHLIRLDSAQLVFQTYENAMRTGAKTVLSFPS